MKQVYVFLLAVCTTGCKEKKSTASEFPQPDAAANLPEKVTRNLFRYFNEHNWQAVEALYHDSVLREDPVLPVPVTGKTDLTSFYASVPDIKDEIRYLYVNGETVIVEFLSTGTMPDSTRFRMAICSVLTIHDGLITRDATYYDK